ncbi:endonuclease/exonuclease/phosphatase family protein [Stappia sp. MMSF_3263]|uniref:endonuclease/exonuclease/phosphatase family protein n=1 Tax=Stappia sp. MMSF_3263 TaxID=3046693 RepID=UPI00273DAC0B|nr:endonuclease/exonuclease/phosphatase family protein [Stappia sp. MMSF_3263]
MRGRDYLTVGFWNIEKHNALPAEGQAAFESQMLRRSSFVMRWIERWFASSRFDILILAEVAQRRDGGDRFARALANRLSRRIGLLQFDMQGAFHWSEGNGGRVSPCNFAVIWNNSIPQLAGLGSRVRFFWEPDWVRPMIILQGQTLAVGGLHAKAARRDLAQQEILGACYFLDELPTRAVLIGDMNIPYSEFPEGAARELANRYWERRPPGLEATHKSRGGRYREAVLDYIWHDEGTVLCRPDPPDADYNGWEENDHAPIQYDVVWNVDGYDKADEMDWDEQMA